MVTGKARKLRVDSKSSSELRSCGPGEFQIASIFLKPVFTSTEENILDQKLSIISTKDALLHSNFKSPLPQDFEYEVKVRNMVLHLIPVSDNSVENFTYKSTVLEKNWSMVLWKISRSIMRYKFTTSRYKKRNGIIIWSVPSIFLYVLFIVPLKGFKRVQIIDSS